MAKRFGSIAVLVVAAALAAPTVASAVNVTIDNPANGSVVDALPVPTNIPAASFSGGYTGWFSTPNCDYTGGTLNSGLESCASLTLERPSQDGTYTLLMSGTITDGVTPIGDSATSTFKLDTVDPVVNILTPASGIQTNDKSPTITFSGSDANPLTYTCWVDGTPVTPCSSPFTHVVDLSDATHSFQVSATDGANTGTSSTVFVTVDTVAPTVNVTFPTPSAIVDSSVPEVNMAVDGATGGSFCRYDANEYQSCGASWLGGSLADGAHTLSVRAVDLAGNETVVVVPFFVDDSLQSGPLPQSVSLTNSQGTKPKRGKFKVKVGLSVLPSDLNFLDQACTGTVTFAIKPKGGKSYSKRTSLKLANGRCTTSGFVTLPAKFKGKKGKLTARYHGSMLISSFKRSRSIKKL